MDARSMRGQNESSEPAGATAAAVAPAGSLDSFCPLIDLASIISDSRRDKAARHAEKPYPARKVQDLPGCYVRSSGLAVPSVGLRPARGGRRAWALLCGRC